MTKDEALLMALEALEAHADIGIKSDKAITAIKEALVNVATNDTSKECVDEMQKQRHEQEPVAWCIVENGRAHGLVKSKPAVMNAEKWQPLYTHPPQRTWQGLTDEEIDVIDEATWDEDHKSWGIDDFARAIEAKLKEKNT